MSEGPIPRSFDRREASGISPSKDGSSRPTSTALLGWPSGGGLIGQSIQSDSGRLPPRLPPRNDARCRPLLHPRRSARAARVCGVRRGVRSPASLQVTDRATPLFGGRTAIPAYAPCPRPDEAISNRNRRRMIEVLSGPETRPPIRPDPSSAEFRLHHRDLDLER